MNNRYDDIRALTTAKPTWWDENAVPRYCPFSPGAVADIYCDEAVLFEIQCQNCRTSFEVCLTNSALSRGGGPSLADLIRVNELEYADPPNIDCCLAGPTMNSIPIRVLEYWRQDDPLHDWERDPSLEVKLVCDWMEETP